MKQSAKPSWNGAPSLAASHGRQVEDAASGSMRLSEVLYGLRWREHLPMALAGGVTASLVSWPEAAPFVEANYVEVFGQQRQFFACKDPAARSRYLESVADIFLFRRDQEIIGSYICNPIDWSTYYLRSVMLLKSAQGLGIVPEFTKRLCQVLARAGVERVEADTAPSNMAAVAVLVRSGFYMSGTSLSDRWGAQSKFVRLLNEESREVYLRQFSVCEERVGEKNMNAGDEARVDAA